MNLEQSSRRENYIVAKKAVLNGVAFDSVGVKFKGNSSYKAANKKNPLHIGLDAFKKGQEYQGEDELKLSNVFADPTYVREPLSYEILRNYMPAPRANYIKVYINEQYYGMMVNQEPIDKGFAGTYFGSKTGTLVKCNPVGGAVPGGGTGGSPSLQIRANTVTDSTQYYTSYEIKSDYGWKNLLKLIDVLNNRPAEIESILNVDTALWMLAFNNVFVNLDSYSGSFNQNYYLYQDANGRFNTIVWDLNQSFGSFNMLGGTTGSLTPDGMKNMDILTHLTNIAKPLIYKLLNNPIYKRMYLAHIRTMVNEHFANGKYLERASAMRALIDADVKADANSFYTYTAYQDGMTTAGASTGQPGGNAIGIQTLMGGRVAYFKANANFTAVPPTITATPTTTVSGSTVSVKLVASNAKTAWLYYRSEGENAFSKAQMYDDGLHNDSAANDGIFGASVSAKATVVQYYTYTENDNAGIFTPEHNMTAYYEVQIAKPAVSIKKGEVVINEFVADNTKGEKTAAGKYEDWFELYNNTSAPINLAGWYLTDDKTNANKWVIPENTTIAAKGFLSIWADENGSATDGKLHANFKLSKSGEFLMLSDGGNTILDSLSFGAQKSDVSFGRSPDGTGLFKSLDPTFGQANKALIVANEADSVPSYMNLTQNFPNPFGTQSEVQFTLSEAGNVSLKIFDTLGREVQTVVNEIKPIGSHTVMLNAKNLPNGVYLYQLQTQNQVVTRKMTVAH